MKIRLLIAVTALLAGCAGGPPVPDWQIGAHDALDRAVAAYMGGNSRVETAEWRRAREQLGSTGKVELLIRAELLRCAGRVAALDFTDCAGFDALRTDAQAADLAYAAWLAGRLAPQQAALLPPAQRAVATAGSDVAAAAAQRAIADPLSALVAAGVLLRSGRATPALLEQAVETASAQGWRRPLLAWLEVQARRAEQAGQSEAAQRLRRRIALVSAAA